MESVELIDKDICAGESYFKEIFYLGWRKENRSEQIWYVKLNPFKTIKKVLEMEYIDRY